MRTTVFQCSKLDILERLWFLLYRSSMWSLSSNRWIFIFMYILLFVFCSSQHQFKWKPTYVIVNVFVYKTVCLDTSLLPPWLLSPVYSPRYCKPLQILEGLISQFESSSICVFTYVWLNERSLCKIPPHTSKHQWGLCFQVSYFHQVTLAIHMLHKPLSSRWRSFWSYFY